MNPHAGSDGSGRSERNGSVSAFFDEWTPAPAAPEASSAPVKRGGPRRPRRRSAARMIAATAVLGSAAALAVLPVTTASADPSSNDWYRLRMCESSNNYAINTGNNHYGAYQFDLSTWQSVGGSGYPNNASPGEQDARALILYLSLIHI